MKSKNILLGILALLLVITMTAVGCDNDSTDDNNPQTAIFQGIAAGYKYVLTITENKSRAAYTPQKKDSYKLLITKTGEADKESTGEVSDVSTDGNTLTLQPKTANSPTFRVKKSGQNITEASDPITLDDGTTVTAGSFEESGEPSQPDATFTSVEAMKTWLAAQPDNTINTPYTVKLNVAELQQLAMQGDYVDGNWIGNYVIIDLSGSTFTSFNYWSSMFIVGITFPASLTKTCRAGDFELANISSLTFLSTIAEEDFLLDANMWGDLKTKYLAGGQGTYTTTPPWGQVWTKQ